MIAGGSDKRHYVMKPDEQAPGGFKVIAQVAPGSLGRYSPRPGLCRGEQSHEVWSRSQYLRWVQQQQR